MKKSYDRMDGHTFEHNCAGLLRRNGFHHVEVTRGSGDQGIDILAWKHRKKYGIQCKCYSYYLGNKAIQEAYAGMTSQLFGPGGEEDIALRPGQLLGGLRRTCLLYTSPMVSLG